MMFIYVNAKYNKATYKKQPLYLHVTNSSVNRSTTVNVLTFSRSSLGSKQDAEK